MKYEIKVACDTEECEQFVEWLNEQGHSAEMSNSSGNYINGLWTSVHEIADEIMRRLWSEYCNS